MNVLLISPVANPSIRFQKALRIPNITLSLLATLTPPEHRVNTIEEEIEDIDFDTDCDLVGISCATSNALRAYSVADEFRRRGKRVVLGGIHPTVLPQEAITHADAVVVGEAEEIWPVLLNDAKENRLKPMYTGTLANLESFPVVTARPNQKKGFVNVMPILTTKGCPYNCDFCSVGVINGNKIRHIPISRVVETIKASSSNIFLFLDDNIIARKSYARELFTALIPLNIKWVGQASISFADDVELMALAKKAGCYCLFFGLESVSPAAFEGMHKLKSAEKSADAIAKIRDMGIAFHASVIFGFDTDDDSIFDLTLEFLMKTKIHSTTFNVLTPYPGTVLFDQMERDNRILTKNWNLYDHSTVVFQPKLMSPERLMEQYLTTKKEFYSFSNILRRAPGNMHHPLVYFGMNLAFRKSSGEILNDFRAGSGVLAQDYS
ncbi:MAG: B12-binding domain-containing radical SAM protein [Spirochaetales bacterium]|nr:B12-binding domain-containing radical SAM protein [Spirochaetales bacterium]